MPLPEYIRFGDLYLPPPTPYNSDLEYIVLSTRENGIFYQNSIRRIEYGFILVGTMGTGDRSYIDRITGNLTLIEIVEAIRKSKTYNNPNFPDSLKSMIEFVTAESTKPPLRLMRLKDH